MKTKDLVALVSDGKKIKFLNAELLNDSRYQNQYSYDISKLTLHNKEKYWEYNFDSKEKTRYGEIRKASWTMPAYGILGIYNIKSLSQLNRLINDVQSMYRDNSTPKTDDMGGTIKHFSDDMSTTNSDSITPKFN